MNQLSLKYQYDGTPTKILDDFGRLSVSVDARFSGQGGFWVQWQDVREFGESLSSYPLEASVVAQWGYNMQEGDDLILRLEIAPANLTGDLLVTVEIADDLQDHGGSDRVKSSFLTNYPQLESFRLAIDKLMDGEVSEAVLQGQ